MSRFQIILAAVALVLPFALDVLVDSQSKAAWKTPQASINPDIDVIRHFYGDGQ